MRVIIVRLLINSREAKKNKRRPREDGSPAAACTGGKYYPLCNSITCVQFCTRPQLNHRTVQETTSRQPTVKVSGKVRCYTTRRKEMVRRI